MLLCREWTFFCTVWLKITLRLIARWSGFFDLSEFVGKHSRSLALKLFVTFICLYKSKVETFLRCVTSEMAVVWHITRQTHSSRQSCRCTDARHSWDTQEFKGKWGYQANVQDYQEKRVNFNTDIKRSLFVYFSGRMSWRRHANNLQKKGLFKTIFWGKATKLFNVVYQKSPMTVKLCSLPIHLDRSLLLLAAKIVARGTMPTCLLSSTTCLKRTKALSSLAIEQQKKTEKLKIKCPSGLQLMSRL